MTTRGPGDKVTTELPAEPTTTPHGPVPEDEQELRQQIEHTREQLGETVEQLAAKTDVTGRARAKAAEAAGRVKDSMGRARARAAIRVQATGSQAADQATPAWEKAPEPLRHTIEKAVSAANQRKVPLAVASAALIAGYLAVRWWRKR